MVTADHGYCRNKIANVREGGGQTFGASATSARSGHFIASVEPGAHVPFFLPDTRADRQLRVDVGAAFHLTSSFAADTTGEYCLKLTKPKDAASLNHISTRASASYEITLPPDDPEKLGWTGELGVWFETDWGRKGVIVKGTKRGKFAFDHTDIHAGDVLVSVDGISVTNKSFDDIMEKLKTRFKESNAVVDVDGFGFGDENENENESRPNQRKKKSKKVALKFLTLEERMRLVRLKALKHQHGDEQETADDEYDQDDLSSPKKSVPGEADSILNVFGCGKFTIRDADDEMDMSKARNEIISAWNSTSNSNDDFIAVEMKNIASSLFLFVKAANTSVPPYKVVNDAIDHVISVRQRGCEGHPWKILLPGMTISYTWEEPMKPRKLSVRVLSTTKTRKSLHHAHHHSHHMNIMSGKKKKKLFGVENEHEGAYGATRTVKLDEIGFSEYLPSMCKEEDDTSDLFCRVDADGATRVLTVTVNGNTDLEKKVIEEHVDVLEKEMLMLSDDLIKYSRLQKKLEISTRASIVSALEAEMHYKLDDDFDIVDEDERGSNILREKSTARPKLLIGDSSLGGLSSSSRGEGGGISLNEINEELLAECEEVCEESNFITKTDQLFVEIIEAIGLRATDLSGLSDPYCVVKLMNRDGGRRKIFNGDQKRKTYFVEKTLNPKWKHQAFVFDVNREAVSTTRGFFLRVRIKDFSLLGAGACVVCCSRWLILSYTQIFIKNAATLSRTTTTQTNSWDRQTCKCTACGTRRSKLVGFR